MHLKDKVLDFVVNNPECDTIDILDKFDDHNAWVIITILQDLQLEGKIE